MDGEQDDEIQLSQDEIRELLAQRDNLQAERDAERRRADAETNRADMAESARDGAHHQLASATVAGLSAQEHSAQREIEAATAEIEQIKRSKTALMEEGKFAEASELDEKMAEAAARRHSAIQAKGQLAGQRERVAAEPTSPVERFLAANTQYSEAERQWIRQNPRYATDRGFHERVNAAHNEVTGKGIERGTPEYFKAIGDAGYMRAAPPAAAPTPPRQQQRQQQQPIDGATDDDDDPYSSAAGTDDDATPPQRPAPRQAQRPAMNAAPPSRRPAGSPRPANGQQVRLTPEQAEAAIALSEYFPEDVQNGGDAAIYAYYATLNSSPMANRKRDEWRNGA